MHLNTFLDTHYGEDGAERLREWLVSGEDPNLLAGTYRETALHVAARRRRLDAVAVLIEHGAELDATNRGGKTAYAHARRRGFVEICKCLAAAGCSTDLNEADRFAVAVTENRLEDAKAMLAANPTLVKTGNPEEDRLLADIAGRDMWEAVMFLVAAGADIEAPGLDGGTPLHMTAWFGQPKQAAFLVRTGAKLEVVDEVNGSTPLGWVVHGSRYSGGVESRQDAYAAIAETLSKAGAHCHLPGAPDDDSYWRWMLETASPRVKAVLVAHHNK